jgi:hypothetical protein
MYEPTKEMRIEAERAGTWRSRTFNSEREYARVQLITIAEAFSGRRVEFPGENRTLKSSPPAAPPKGVNLTLPGILEPGSEPASKRRTKGRTLTLPKVTEEMTPPPDVTPSHPGVVAAKPRRMKGLAKTSDGKGDAVSEEQRTPAGRRRRA